MLFIILVFNLGVKLRIDLFRKDDNHHVLPHKGLIMKYLRNIGLVLLIILLLASCKKPQSMFSQGVSQGVSGQVLWYEGDLMPGFDKEPVVGKPIQREIYIYRATKMEQAEVRDGSFFSNIKTELVHKSSSDEEGRFIISLEPGTYSVFVKEKQGLFASRFDQSGIINPVTIGKSELVSLLIKVDYNAAY
jgi:hypothetical protein